MLRIIAAIIFISAGTIAGASRAYTLKYKLEICQSIKIMLREITLYIRSTGADVYRIVSELKKIKSLESLLFIEELPTEFEPDSDFRSKWRKAVNAQTDLPDEEKKILLSLGDIIGTSDIEGQMTAINGLQSELDAIEQTRRDMLIKKGKLYRSVGMLFGVMAGILVI